MKRKLILWILVCAAAVSCASAPKNAKSKTNIIPVAPSAVFSLEMRFVEKYSTDSGKIYQIRETGEQLILEDRVLFTQNDIKKAETVRDNYGGYAVSFTFSADAAKRFSDLTAENKGRRIAIVINGEAVSAPVIQEQISGGTGEIHGNLSEGEARTLAKQLSGK
ncbi:MAG: SecDF P1 head subdomain-containing protein [Spirochaetota bacterium]